MPEVRLWLAALLAAFAAALGWQRRLRHQATRAAEARVRLAGLTAAEATRARIDKALAQPLPPAPPVPRPVPRPISEDRHDTEARLADTPPAVPDGADADRVLRDWLRQRAARP